jgi:hypothetical protein
VNDKIMQGFNVFIEKRILISELKDAMKRIFPRLNFLEWNFQEQIIDGEEGTVLTERDVLIELTYKPGLFLTLVEFYRLPGDESTSRMDLFVGRKLSKAFNCKTTIDGYRYCSFDQMPDYSLLLENDKAYLIGDCYPEKDWKEDDERINRLEINIIKEIDLSPFKETFNDEGLLAATP